MSLRSFVLFIFYMFISCSRLSGQGVQNTEEMYLDDKFYNPITLNPQVGKVRSVVRDNQGFLWIAGRNGLAKYDGTTFKHYKHDPSDSLSIMSNDIHHMFYDSLDEKIWLSIGGAIGGKSVLNLKSEKFTNYIFNAGKNNGIIGNNTSWTFKDKHNNVWSNNKNQGLLLYRPDQMNFKNYKLEVDTIIAQLSSTQINGFRSYSFDAQNDSLLWLGTSHGIAKYNVLSKTFDFYPFSQSNLDVNSRSIYAHSKTAIFVGTWKNGLFKFNPITKVFKKCNLQPLYLKEYGNVAINYMKLYPKDKNHLYVTANSGLGIYNVKEDKVKSKWFNNTSENLSYGVRHLDSDRNIYNWIDGNLIIFEKIRHQGIYYKTEISDPPYACIFRKIIEDTISQNIWLAGQGSEGLYNLNLQNNHWETIKTNNTKFDAKDVMSIWDMIRTQRGEFIILTEDSLFVLSKENTHLIPWSIQPKPLRKTFRKIIEDQNENIWIGDNYSGLIKINKARDSIRYFTEELLTKGKSSWNAIWDLMEDRNGNIWIRSEGYSVYVQAKDSIYNFPFFFREEKVIYHINSFGKNKDGNVLIGSQRNSVGITDADHPEAGIVQYIEKSNGLRTGNPSHFQLDYENNIWIAGTASLEKISASLDSNAFYRNEYLAGSSIWSLTELKDRRLVLGHKRGISIFHPDSLKIEIRPPDPYVTFVKVFDSLLTFEKPVYQIEGIDLDPNQNFFTIGFSALTHQYQMPVKFQYKLEGIDPDWVNVNNIYQTSYTSIKGGNYPFKLRARSLDSDWSEEKVCLYLNIKIPWYKTNWFIATFSFAFLGIGFALYKWRTNNIRIQEQLQANIQTLKLEALQVQMNPHFIFNCLNTVDSYIAKNDQLNASRYLTEFSALIRLTLNQTRKDVTTLEDELAFVKKYVKLEQERFEPPFEFNFKIDHPEILSKIQIPPLLIQPAVENSIWHGLAHRNDNRILQIKDAKNDKNYEIHIIDNGPGFNNKDSISSTQASHALNIIKERCALFSKTHSEYSIEYTIGVTEDGKTKFSYIFTKL